MNNNFNLKQFLAEGRLLKEDIQSSFKQLLDAIPNKKYFYIADEQADTFFNPEENGPDYDYAGFDTDDGDLVDYFYDDIFDNELKGKPGIEGNNFNEWQSTDREENPTERGSGENESLLYNKIKQIIIDYKKSKFSEEIPLSPEIKDYIDETIQGARDRGEFDYLLNAGFFGTDLADNILTEFMDEYPNAYTLSQEVEDYIDSQL
jgi:hypothetical protein